MRAIAILWVLAGSSACAPAQPAAQQPAAPAARSAPALFERGLALANQGDAVRAEQYLVMAMRAGHPQHEVIVPLVRVCIASARLRAALAHAEPFLRAHPRVWPLRYLVAAIRLALDQPVQALDELRQIAAQEPGAAHAHYLIAVTLRDELHDHAAARASFETYLRLAPGGARAAEAAAFLAEPAALGPELPASAAKQAAP